jgi:hypothetical protein
VQRLAAGDERLRVRRARQQLGDRRRGLHDLLEIVEEHEQPLVADVLEQLALRADPGLDGVSDERRISKGLERNPVDAVGEGFGPVRGDLQREPRLPAAARTGERHQPAGAHQLAELSELPRTPDERRLLDRQIRPVERLQRRELRLADLPDPLRRAEVLQAVLAEIAEAVGLHERGRRRRDENLAAVSRGGDASRSVDVSTHVALIGQQRRAGVDAHPHGNRQGLLCLARRCERTRSGSEGDEERVSLRVDLHAVVPRERVAEHRPVLVQFLGVALRTELVQQAGRALDVGEKERDRAARQLAHAQMIRQKSPRD